MTLRVTDCHAVYEALRSRGAVFLTPPHDWARRSAAFCETRWPPGGDQPVNKHMTAADPDVRPSRGTA
jgi:hypothetical protein